MLSKNSPTSAGSGMNCYYYLNVLIFLVTKRTLVLCTEMYYNIISRKEKGLIILREMDHNAHSVFLLYYHLVMVVKYRRKVIDDQISDHAKNIFEYISPKYGIVLEEWNHDQDHVHVMFRAQPKSEISKFINAYKSASSRLLKKEYPQIREKLWKEAFWSQSFCLMTAGGAPIEVIRSYIESQGEKDEQSIQVSDLSDQGAGDSDP